MINDMRQAHINVMGQADIDTCMDVAAAKRLGWILESLDISAQSMEQLLTMPSKGYRKLDPTGPGSGRCNKRWMIQENLPGRIFS